MSLLVERYSLYRHRFQLFLLLFLLSFELSIFPSSKNQVNFRVKKGQRNDLDIESIKHFWHFCLETFKRCWRKTDKIERNYPLRWLFLDFRSSSCTDDLNYWYTALTWLCYCILLYLTASKFENFVKKPKTNFTFELRTFMVLTSSSEWLFASVPTCVILWITVFSVWDSVKKVLTSVKKLKAVNIWVRQKKIRILQMISPDIARISPGYVFPPYWIQKDKNEILLNY